MALDKPWERQPRWPGGTPNTPHGPGGGRWRDGGPPTPGIPGGGLDWADRIGGRLSGGMARTPLGGHRITGFHGRHDGRDPNSLDTVFVAPERDYANEFAASMDASAPSAVYGVDYTATNPLHVRDAATFRQAWSASGADQINDGRFHGTPGTATPSRAFTEWARAQGHDAVILHPEAFDTEDQADWELMVGNFGDPQSIILNPAGATFTRLSGGMARTPLDGPPMPDRESSPADIAAWARSIGPEGAQREVVMSRLGGPGAGPVENWRDEKLVMPTYPVGDRDLGRMPLGTIRPVHGKFKAITITQDNPYSVGDIERGRHAQGPVFDSENQANVYLWRWGQTTDGRREWYNATVLGEAEALGDHFSEYGEDDDFAPKEVEQRLRVLMARVQDTRDLSNAAAWDRAVDNLREFLVDPYPWTDPDELPDPDQFPARGIPGPQPSMPATLDPEEIKYRTEAASHSAAVRQYLAEAGFDPDVIYEQLQWIVGKDFLGTMYMSGDLSDPTGARRAAGSVIARLTPEQRAAAKR